MNKATSTNCIFSITDLLEVKHKVLNWANRFDTFCFLDNHQYQISPHTQECLLAAGRKNSVESNAGDALEMLDHYFRSKADGHTDNARLTVPGLTGVVGWRFVHLGFDLKNEIENLPSNHEDNIQFSDLFFFEP